ncbi:hypothetical protein KQI68_07595 [Peptoniphilus sp. MSJ-1]|uniref:ABC-2 family transporter protein n=1 Tax=Peptoniphilus ovalis TaxID=2841503 RepID=A0ABS6FHP4_9FIRM|nr:hypothetical protein [Peptoniphilus ovalis]MBU5669695.1 hypothetical protein [Peptoniphilus ovalis]
MKTLLLNSYKIKKKQIIYYFIFIALLILIKTLGMNIDSLNILAGENFSVVFVTITLLHFALFLIADNNLIVDNSNSYLLMLKNSRRDLLNWKFIETFIIFVINILTIFYLMHDINIHGLNKSLGLLIILTFMSYYLILIPLSMKFAKDSAVPTLITFAPALIPWMDKIGLDPVSKVIEFYENTNKIIPFALLILYLILIYVISLGIINNKDF